MDDEHHRRREGSRERGGGGESAEQFLAEGEDERREKLFQSLFTSGEGA